MSERGERFRRLRESFGLSTKRLSEGSGLTSSYISQLEHGANPGYTPAVTTGLASAYGLHPVAVMAYLEGHLVLEDIVATGPSSLDVAVAYHGPDRWSAATLEAARCLSLSLEPAQWAAQLDQMEAAGQAVDGLWDHVIAAGPVPWLRKGIFG